MLRVHSNSLNRNLWQERFPWIEPLPLTMDLQFIPFLLVNRCWFSLIPSSSLKLVFYLILLHPFELSINTWCNFHPSIDLLLTIPIQPFSFDCTCTCAFTSFTIFNTCLQEWTIDLIINFNMLDHRTRVLTLFQKSLHQVVNLEVLLSVDVWYVYHYKESRS